MISLDWLQVLLLGSLFAVTFALVVVVGVGVGGLAWGWSIASRYETLSANRDESGGVVLTAKLRRKDGKKVRKLLPASNGVRHVERGQA